MLLRLLQMNLHHCTVAATLLLHLAGGGAEIVLIQEPWLVSSKVSGLGTPNFKLIVPEAQGIIRTCILARKRFSTLTP